MTRLPRFTRAELDAFDNENDIPAQSEEELERPGTDIVFDHDRGYMTDSQGVTLVRI